MTALERVSTVLERARIDGGWIDETVAAAVLAALGLDENGQPVALPPSADGLDTA